MTIDTLVKHAIAYGEIVSGVPMAITSRRSQEIVHIAMLPTQRQPKSSQRPPAWSGYENAYLKKHHGKVAEEDIASHLGRTVNAVHLHWKRDLKLPAPSRHPLYITANQAGEFLGVDPHKVIYWIDAGILPGEHVPGNRNIRRVLRSKLIFWATRPENWIWFRPESICDRKLRKFALLKKRQWGDEWWSTAQVAHYHGVEPADVVRYIEDGKLAGVQARGRGGRHKTPGWSNWFILKSEATRESVHFYKGNVGNPLEWSAGADEFIIIASAIGISSTAIGNMIGGEWDCGRVKYRLGEMLENGKAQNAKGIDFSRGILWANWRDYTGRFPGLVRSMRHFVDYLNGGRKPDASDLLYIRGVFQVWAARFAHTPEQYDLARRLNTASHAGAEYFRNVYQVLLGWGIDPIGLCS